MLPAAHLLYINCTDMQMTGTRNTVTTPVAARSVFFIYIYFFLQGHSHLVSLTKAMH